MAKGNCCVCGKKLGLRGIMLKGSVYACFDCVKASGHNPMTWMGNLLTSEEDFKQLIIDNQNKPDINSGENKERKPNFVEKQKQYGEFHATKTVGNIMKIDENSKSWYVQDQFGLHKSQIHQFEEILGYELLEDGDSITSGGLGRATVGALTFGAAGAIVGGLTGKRKTKTNCTSLRVKVTLNDMSFPVEYIDLIKTTTRRDSSMYKSAMKQAQEIISILQVISEMKKDAVSQNQTSTADEIKKFKELQEQGIISTEEFEVQKKKLLGM